MPLLKTVQRVVVTCHKDPDGDAMAALLAVSQSLQRLRRWDVRAISPGPVPVSYRFLPGWEKIEPYSLDRLETAEGASTRDAILAADVIISLDASDLPRLGLLYSHNPSKLESVKIINIDHHPSNTNFGTVNLVDPSAAAVCELLVQIMEQEDLPITEDIANALLVGIVTDTLGFRTPSTSATTLRVAATLMERGASLSHISERIFNTRSPKTLRLWGKVLSRTHVDDGIVWADITSQMLEECDASLEDADSLVDFIAGVPETNAAFLFSEQSGKVRVSMRTSDMLNAAELARSFGGGGHLRAAGCTLAGTMGEVQTRILNEARRRIELMASGGEGQ
ncbi:MAG: DHH family phosphoesterase [Chloroflexota bacterium]